MTAKHKVLIKKTKEAVDAVFSDRSVSQSQTKDSLEGLRDYIEESIDALRSDVEASELENDI